ncbi:MAG: TRAP transporter small permease subunit [Syntrophorhabdus sp.]|jgi:TRAP-type C4-dicarboxylate transport system permease small subunit|nr:TRAP transporter small permease [Syntrophorhabdus sp.]OPX99985.1 MAG: Tripartite ATP-independent periplasmic transporter [Syntrophorhabdus sp. PtaB.Bin027]OQB76574.1 MAG: Tripartite ATP-independent periplasmic transporter [Deltaproteobacteria bacterium ADurb.Bin135]HNQ46619.1 TRAP transporter small permease subunit [Syntrophorhabdus sp.]HOD79386.1 TRAP transporter small permease subunit [Syntrophorhabdus sp.]
MKRFVEGVAIVDKLLYIIAGSVLACMIILTFFDVILRNLGHPITGSMEIIQYGGAIVFGFSVPYGTMLGAQVIVDIVTEKLSPKKKRTIEIITRCVGVLMFLFVAYNFFIYGIDVQKTGERTASFKIPYYPFAFALSFSFFLQSFTIFCDLIKKVKGAENE